MTRFSVFFIAVAACALFATACGDSEDPIVDACAEIEDQTYLSIAEYECGLGPNGVEMCNWNLYFAGGEFDWSFSDIAASGTYTCDGATILGITGGNEELDGFIDAETGGADLESSRVSAAE